MKNNQKGFSAVEILLALIFVAIVIFIGVYIAQNRNSDTTAEVTTSSKSAKKVAKTTDPTAEWTAYGSTSGRFTFKYPKTWVMATNPELCSDGILLLGADSSSVGKCASEDFGQMTITWRSDRAVCDDLNSETWTQDSKQTVSVSGVNGTKITATAKAPGYGLGSIPEGTKTTQYCFVANGTTYIASYYQLSTYPDVLSDFNTMVTKTLKFN